MQFIQRGFGALQTPGCPVMAASHSKAICFLSLNLAHTEAVRQDRRLCNWTTERTVLTCGPVKELDVRLESSASPNTLVVRRFMADIRALQHSAAYPVTVQARLPRRLHFQAAYAQRNAATPSISPGRTAPRTSNIASNAARHTPAQPRSPVACSAAASSAAPAAPAQQIDTVPRGETAGANLILENATVQAGHRDLLEVSTCCLPAIPSTTLPLNFPTACTCKPTTDGHATYPRRPTLL